MCAATGTRTERTRKCAAGPWTKLVGDREREREVYGNGTAHGTTHERRGRAVNATGGQVRGVTAHRTSRERRDGTVNATGGQVRG